MSDQLGPIEVEFLINDAEVKQKSSNVEKDIISVADTAEKAAERMQRRVEKVYQFTNEQALALNTSYGEQMKAQKKSIDINEAAVAAVSDQYQGLLAIGLDAWNELDEQTRKASIQLLDAQSELKNVSAAQSELNTRFKEGQISATQYSTALAALKMREAQVKGEIDSVTASMKLQGNAFAGTKGQLDNVGDSVTRLTRKIPQFTYSARSGFMGLSSAIPGLVDEISSLAEQNEALNASGKKGVPIWKQILTGLISWQTALAVGVTLLSVYGKEIGNWIMSLVSAGKAVDAAREKHRALIDSFQSDTYKKAVNDIMEVRQALNLAEKGLIDNATALQVYNSRMGDAIGEANSLAEAEEKLINSGEAYIRMLLNRVAAELVIAGNAEAMLTNAQKQYEAQRKINGVMETAAKLEQKRRENAAEFTENDKLVLDNVAVALRQYEQQLIELREQENKLNTENANIAGRLYEKAAEIAKDFGFDLFGKSNINDGNKVILSSRQSLLDKLAALDREYARKRFDSDQEELQALRDKFTKIREEVARFNADPKNKTAQIDISFLDTVEQQALEDMSYRQGTNKIVQELEKYKAQFAEFTEYKQQFGLEAAKEQYSALMDEHQSYLSYLKSKLSEEAEVFGRLMTGQGVTGAEGERLALIMKELEKENKVQERAWNERLASLMNYEQKRNKLISDHQQIRNELISKGYSDQLAMQDEAFAKELDALDNEHLAKEKAYQDLWADISFMTEEQIAEIIKNAEALFSFDWLNVTPEQAEKIKNQIKRLTNSIGLRDIEKFQLYAFELGNLGASISELGSANNINAIADFGSAIAGIAQTLQNALVVFDEFATKEEKLAAAINATANLINMAASATVARRKAEEDFYRRVTGFQHEYNLSLVEQIRLQGLAGESIFLPNYMARVQAGYEAATEAGLKYQEAFAKIQGGQAITGQRNGIDWGNVGKGAGSGATLGAAISGPAAPIGALIGAVAGGLIGLFAGMKKKDTITPILEAYPKLIEESENGMMKLNKELAQMLINQGLVTDETAATLKEIMDMDDALQAAKDQIAGVVQELVGTLGSDLKNALVEAFRAGEDAGVVMADNIGKSLENIVSNLIFQQLFGQVFKDLQERLSESFVGDGDFTDDLGDFFQEAKGLGDQFNKAMRQAQEAAKQVGLDIFQPNDSRGGLQGAIRRELTEKTASELTGLYRATFDLQKRHYESHAQLLATEQQALDVSLRMLAQSALIERNTFDTVLQMKLAIIELKLISKNTKSSSSRDLGI